MVLIAVVLLCCVAAASRASVGGSAPAPAPVAPAARGATAELDLHYDVYYSLLHLLTIESKTHVEPDVYSLESHMQTVGLLGTLFPWTYRSEVHGRVDGAQLKPDFFSSHSEIRDRVQQVSLRYGAAGPQVDELTAFDSSAFGQDYTRDEVPPDLRAGTIDPLTEIISVSQQLARGEGCGGVRSVFDGLRRYDVVYQDMGDTELESSSYDSYAGRARECRSVLKPIAGFWKPKDAQHDKADKADAVTSITAWLMPPQPGFEPVPVRMSVEGERGTLTIHLTKASGTAS
jgi:hypothetical protein